MSENTMPAAEAAAAARDDERAAYEFAFHVLPTVAEGEVAGVFEELKTLITKHHGELFSEELPKRFDLAYEIVKHLEGKNRKFSSAYFGWVRFRLDPAALSALTEDIEADRRLLRYLIVKLTRIEEENPFFFHEALEAAKAPVARGDEEVVESDDESTDSDGAEDASDADTSDSAEDTTDAEKKDA